MECSLITGFRICLFNSRTNWMYLKQMKKLKDINMKTAIGKLLLLIHKTNLIISRFQRRTNSKKNKGNILSLITKHFKMMKGKRKRRMKIDFI